MIVTCGPVFDLMIARIGPVWGVEGDEVSMEIREDQNRLAHEYGELWKSEANALIDQAGYRGDARITFHHHIQTATPVPNSEETVEEWIYDQATKNIGVGIREGKWTVWLI